MTQPFYTAQTDVAVGSRGKASDINNLDSAVEQGFKNAHAYGIDSGTSAAYVVTMDTDATAYYDGMVVSFAPDNTNSVQSPTINVNGLGAKATSSANQLSGVVEIGEIKTGYVYTFVYYSTGFVLQGSARLNTIPGPIGSGTPSTGAFTTLSATGQITSTLANGTAPLVVASSTVVGNLNVSQLLGATWAAPGTIGSGTPSSGAFTTLSATTHINYRGGDNASATNSGYGEGALSLNSGGLANTAIGAESLSANAGGVGNTAVGRYCLKAVVSGQNNTAIGYTAAQTYTGSGIVAVGTSALSTNSSGTGCTAVGFESLKDNSTGSNNTAVGYTSAVAYTGDGITAVGFEALKASVTAFDPTVAGTAVGYQALKAAIGYGNVAVGAAALTGVVGGVLNVAVGSGALSALTGAASNNVAVGQGNGATLTTGSNNTLIGNYADTIAAASNSTAIGNTATCTASNQVKLGNNSVTEVTTSGKLQILSGTAIPAGGTTGDGLCLSSTANLGVFFGSGAPTLSAAKGSLYLRSDGSTTNDRMYVNTDGGTTWTAVTTAA